MRYYSAPMEGVTGYLFRNAHHRHFPGIDKYFMPFLSPRQEHAFTRKERQDILPAHNEGLAVVPQLLTRQAEDFLWAAGELAAMGYREVNLNLGCPSGTVSAKGKGSGFLAFPDALDAFLDRVFSAAPVAVSVKTRMGVRDPEEFQALLDIYNKYPIAELTIHPRVQKDFYRHPARQSYFFPALARSRSPVCYNGDLYTPEDCAALAAQAPQASALMLGRGLVTDPALHIRARGGPPATKTQLMAFHDELYHGYCAAFDSARNATLRMKELWSYLIRLFQDSERHEKRLRKTVTPQEYEAQVAAIFRDLPLL